MIEHIWIKFHGLICCRRCGIVRAIKNKPCKGTIHVKPREKQCLSSS